jgi:L-glyceraldehyde 3-phosphate reductase
VRTSDFLSESHLSEATMTKVRELNGIAARRGQSLAQLALAWALRDPRMTSLIIGASSVAQLEDNVGALGNLEFTGDELHEIDKYAAAG